MEQFDQDALVGALMRSQRLGFLGSRPIIEAIEHSRSVVDAVSDVEGRVADIGAGGGLPGLVIVHDRPDLDVTMIDRRATRMDALERVVRRHGLTSRVTVMARDVEDVARTVERGELRPFDAVVARGFGPPEVTLGFMRRLVAADGMMVVTEPPGDGDRWAPELLHSCGVERVDGPAAVAVFRPR